MQLNISVLFSWHTFLVFVCRGDRFSHGSYHSSMDDRPRWKHSRIVGRSLLSLKSRATDISESCSVAECQPTSLKFRVWSQVICRVCMSFHTHSFLYTSQTLLTWWYWCCSVKCTLTILMHTFFFFLSVVTEEAEETVMTAWWVPSVFAVCCNEARLHVCSFLADCSKCLFFRRGDWNSFFWG